MAEITVKTVTKAPFGSVKNEIYVEYDFGSSPRCGNDLVNAIIEADKRKLVREAKIALMVGGDDMLHDLALSLVAMRSHANEHHGGHIEA